MATPSPRWAATGTSNSEEPVGARARAGSGRRPPTGPRSRRSRRAQPLGERRPGRRAARCPGGRAATCGRWRWPRRSRCGRRRPGAGRRSGRRRGRTGRRPAGRRSPASSTGLTRPRWVPTWVRAARATRSGSRASASAVEVDRAVAGARHHLDGGAGQLAHLEQAQVVAVVGDPVDQQALAPGDPAAEGEAPQRLGPALGVRSGDHHLAGHRPRAAGPPTSRRRPGDRPPAPPPRTRPAPTRGAGGRPWRRAWPRWAGRHRRC